MRKNFQAFALMLTMALSPSLAQASTEGCSIKKDNSASKRLENSTSLMDIYNVSKLFPGCLKGGGISEEVSDGVVVRLSHHWRSSLRELRGRGASPEFISFVLRHIDATTSSDELQNILSNSKSACPPRAGAICRKIAAAAATALKG
jgi:hypothetical protein